MWSNGNIVGTIACNFKFDGNFINIALSEWTLVNSTLSASLGNLILKATGASEKNPINYYAICNRQKRIFAGDKLYIVAQITAKGGQGLLVYISTDDGNNWIEIYRANNTTNNAFSIDKQIDLSSYEGENIKVKLVANSYNSITSISFSNLAIG